MYLIVDYLSNRSHFVQIDSRCSNLLYSKFGVPQRSILGPELFNLCINDMKKCVPSCTCLQDADNSIIYQHCKVEDIKSCATITTTELLNMLTWPSSNSLVLNAVKKKAMLFTTSQMEKLHSFEQDVIELKYKGKNLENVNEFKPLWITIDKNLNCKKT